MPGIRVETHTNPRTPLRREIGSLYNSEVWWRDRYHDIAARGYTLRTRYRPNWQPSWKELGQDFFNAEDGQANIVSLHRLLLPVLLTSPSRELRWTQSG